MKAVVQLIRLPHWIKNLFVFAPLLFSLRFLDPSSLHRAVLGFFAFSLAASGVYIINDIFDRQEDRAHPRKRHRPLAAGRVSVPLAAVVAAGLLAASVSLSLSFEPRLAAVLGLYLVLNVAYSLALKRVVILDVMLVAFGFLLRVFAGGICIDVPVSSWMLLTTLFLALFLGFGKRRMDAFPGYPGESEEEPSGGGNLEDATAWCSRRERYGVRLLDYLVVICLTLSIMTYSLYAVGAQTVEKLGTDKLVLTVPLVVFGLFYYLYLLYTKNKGGNPVEMLLREPVILIDVGLWGVVVIIVLLFARGQG